MFIHEELQALKKAILPWFYVFLVLSLFFFFFEFRAGIFSGRVIYFPYPSADPMAAKVFLFAKERTLPPDVRLVVTEPISGFTVTAGIALSLSFIVAFPWFLRSFLAYVFEALYDHEKRAVSLAIFPSLILFTAGAVFGFFVVLPPAFSVLYRYATSLGADNFFSVGEFALFVVGVSAACGLMFLIPVLMAGLNYAGATDRKFWMDNWRTAVLIFAVLSAIITPDGSGITMLLLAAPLTGLYFAGSLIGARSGRK